MSENTTTTIGLSKGAHDKLHHLTEAGYFGEMLDCYRFAISLALAHGKIAPPLASRQTIYNTGSFDPDRSIAFAIRTLYDLDGADVYRTAERLAEWGVEEMYRSSQAGDLSIVKLLEEAEGLLLA